MYSDDVIAKINSVKGVGNGVRTTYLEFVLEVITDFLSLPHDNDPHQKPWALAPARIPGTDSPHQQQFQRYGILTWSFLSFYKLGVNGPKSTGILVSGPDKNLKSFDVRNFTRCVTRSPGSKAYLSSTQMC